MLSAPENVAEPITNPLHMVQDAVRAAKAAGLPYIMRKPVKTYAPVLVYRTPEDYVATTLPPMAAFTPLWPIVWSPVFPKHWLQSLFGDGRGEAPLQGVDTQRSLFLQGKRGR